MIRSLCLLLLATPAIAADPAKLLTYSRLTAETGPATVHVVTLSVPITADDKTWRDPFDREGGYWTNFRIRPTYLKVGNVTVPGGPWLVQSPESASVAFAVPGTVTLAGAELRLHRGEILQPRKPVASPFATVTVTADDLKRANKPFQLRVRYLEKLPNGYAEHLPDGMFAALLPATVYPDLYGAKIGTLATEEALPRFDTWNRQTPGGRYQLPDEYAFAFAKRPRIGDPIAVKFAELPGWFQTDPWDEPVPGPRPAKP